MIRLEEKFGYFLVHYNDTEYLTCSKVEALQLAQRTNGWVTWHFNDDVYGAYDWQQQISKSITDLYRERAEQLRKQHDHLVIMYSGGYDSHNMLCAFLDNQIKVDAIVFFYNSMDSNPDTDITLEWKLQTWPRLQNILAQHPEIEFLKIDISHHSLNVIDQHRDDYYYISGGALAPNFIGQSYLQQLLPKKFTTGRLGMLYGVDKPRLRYKNGNFYFNFYDMGHRVKPVIPGSGIEYFYWGRDCPELVIKQAQIAKQYWQANKSFMETHATNKLNADLGLVLDHDWDPLQRLIYPYCSQGIFLTWRPASVTFGQRDKWIYRSNHEAKHKLQDIYKSFISAVDSRWFNQQKPSKGLISHISQDYVL